MKLVMPAVLGSSREEPFLGMMRFECGSGGNPHLHGVGYGPGNPSLDGLREASSVEAPQGSETEMMPRSFNGGGGLFAFIEVITASQWEEPWVSQRAESCPSLIC